MMGIYPDCPGNTNFHIVSPVFDKITIELDPAFYPGEKFVFENENSDSIGIFINSMRLNGKIYKKYTLNHEDIVKGGKFSFLLMEK